VRLLAGDARADLPRDVRTLYIAPVAGDGADPEVSDALARELRRLVRERAYFSVSESESAADAVLRVHLVDFITRRWRSISTTKCSTTRRRCGWTRPWSGKRRGAVRGKGIESTRSNQATAGAVVSTSSRFKRARDPARRFGADGRCAAGESRRRHAHAGIAEDLADAIYSRIMAGSERRRPGRRRISRESFATFLAKRLVRRAAVRDG